MSIIAISREQLEMNLQDAEDKAWAALRRGEFQTFGYWATIWVNINRNAELGNPSPFDELVQSAKDRKE